MTTNQAHATTEIPIQLGPSAADARPGRIAVRAWLVGSGERIKKHAQLVELCVDDAVVVLTAPVRGTLREIRVQPGQQAGADTVLALVDSVEPALEDPKDLLDRIDTAVDPRLAMISALLDIVAVKDPALAEAARACAIPRRFDPDVLALVSGADAIEASRLFAELRRFQFVQTRADGQCSYDESTREALLREWREPDRRDLFVELNRRLQAFHEGEHDRVRQLAADLRRIARVLRRVNRSRYAELAAKVDGLLRATLLELLYHAKQISGEDLYSMFERLAAEYEAQGRLLLCQSLLRSTQSYAQEVALDSERVDWLRYWDGRLLRQLRVDDEAERILGDLIHRLPDSGRLTEWSLVELAYLRASQVRLTEAQELLLRRLAMAESGGVDPRNLGDAHLGVAYASWAIADLDAAIEHGRRALECSAALPFSNLSADVAAWTYLSGALRELGRLTEAREAALAALDLARGEPELRTQTQLQANALLQLIASVVGADVRLSTTLYAEAENLVVEGGDAPDAFSYPEQYADILLTYGRLTAGSAFVDTLRERGADEPDSGGMLTLLEADFAKSQGRFQMAVERLTELLNREEQLPDWQRLGALFARGSCNMELGRWQDAETDLTAALEGWDRLGNTYGVAKTHVCIADLRYRTGQLAASEAALASASAIVGPQRSAQAGNIHGIRAKVRHAQGRVTDAASDANEALKIFRDLGRPVEALRATIDTADLAASHGAWSEAAEAAVHAVMRGRALEKLDGWSPSSRQKNADHANSRGVRVLTDESADPRDAAVRARDFFAAARHGLPGNAWYYLNLSYAHAQLEAWEQAAAAVMKAASVKSALPKTFLRHRLIEYRLRLAEVQAGADAKRAAVTLAQAVADMDKTTPGRLRVEAAVIRGDMILRSSAPDFAAAAKAYRQGLEEAERHGQRAYQLALNARLAVVAALQDDAVEASSRISAAVYVANSMPEASPADQLTAACAAAITTHGQYAVFAPMLALVEERSRVRSWPQGLLTEMRLRLARLWYLQSMPVSEWTPPDSPSPLLQIEVDDVLFPEGDQTPGLLRMRRHHIPAIVDRVYRDIGVSIPSMLIAPRSALFGGAYAISVNQIPCALGQVVPDGVFCDARAARTAGLDGFPYKDPVTGTEGLWLVGDARAAAESMGLPATDAYEFLVRHLETVAREELASLVGVQDVRRLVEALSVTGQISEWERLAESCQNDGVRVFVSVVHALLSEGVPIRNLAAIVSVVAAAAPEIGISQVLQQARAALRHDLPGRNGAGGLLRLRDDLERVLAAGVREGNAEHLVLRSDVADGLHQAVSSDVASAAPIRALLVRDQAVRPFVFTLLARDIDGLPVVSESEVFARGTPGNASAAVGSAGT